MAEKSGKILFLPIVETYDQQIRLMRAEMDRLKTMKSIDQLRLARAEALQLRQAIQLQSDCMKEAMKKKSSTKDLLPLMLFFLF